MKDPFPQRSSGDRSGLKGLLSANQKSVQQRMPAGGGGGSGLGSALFSDQETVFSAVKPWHAQQQQQHSLASVHNVERSTSPSSGSSSSRGGLQKLPSRVQSENLAAKMESLIGALLSAAGSDGKKIALVSPLVAVLLFMCPPLLGQTFLVFSAQGEETSHGGGVPPHPYHPSSAIRRNSKSMPTGSSSSGQQPTLSLSAKWLGHVERTSKDRTSVGLQSMEVFVAFTRLCCDTAVFRSQHLHTLQQHRHHTSFYRAESPHWSLLPV